jgi:hypothetical protein
MIAIKSVDVNKKPAKRRVNVRLFIKLKAVAAQIDIATMVLIEITE